MNFGFSTPSVSSKKRGRSRRDSKSNYLTDAGLAAASIIGVQNLRSSLGNGYKTSLGFGGGSWYFKLWNSSGVQVGATKSNTTLAALRTDVNADATLLTYVFFKLRGGITDLSGNSNLTFARASSMGRGV